jgi:hypothetical protein
VPATPPNSRDPYCSHCGYLLTGLTESSKCPECGKPIVEVLTRPGWAFNFGKRYRSKARLFGWPVIDIALGPRDGQMRGHARGIIAIGDIATGGIAIGGLARGIVALGGLAIGIFAVGGAGLGLLCGAGGLAVGILACGGGAIGVLACGGGAAGIFAQGGGAIGKYWRDGRIRHMAHPNPFDQFHWFFGSWPPKLGIDALHPLLVIAGIAILATALIAVVALPALWSDSAQELKR